MSNVAIKLRISEALFLYIDEICKKLVVGFCFGWHRVPEIFLSVSAHILVILVLAESFTVTYCQQVVCGGVVVGDLVVPYCSSGGGVNFL
jgi:hypothetical protein